MLIDTHCHLGAEPFAADVAGVLERARAAGVGHVVVIGESPAAAARALALVEAHPGLSATAGLHPHEAASWTAETEAWLRAALADPRVVAAGEMGLDYHYDHSPRAVQQAVFEAQLGLAAAAGRPAVIHARDADEDIAAILRNHPQATAILHSFSSGPGLLRSALADGHYVSFSGMVTFRNWGRDDLLTAVPADRILVETDAPYLAPVPHRGQRNEPAFVRDTAARVAAVRGVSLDQCLAETGANAARVFGPRVSG
ncbi:MAG: TatD family hydrolase [Gemmatimonadetes bacterium]|nr:TatD family hydrolase [Gemmatimonadota bacterium]MBK6778904.1 TatD family hydrolase [Gemmatimonadota bacterium]MBK7714350.1 TatD family hydrolase [Gemmatimonadota bacterium]MBK7924354.1 TatD family hydrolase [Gemmatimonadota bacterium]